MGAGSGPAAVSRSLARRLARPGAPPGVTQSGRSHPLLPVVHATGWHAGARRAPAARTPPRGHHGPTDPARCGRRLCHQVACDAPAERPARQTLPVGCPHPADFAETLGGKIGHWRGCQRLRFQCPLSEPCLKLSFTRLSPRKSTRCIPPCHRRCHRAQAIYETPPRYRVGRCGIAHLARGPSLRRVMLSAPIIATMTSSDFRSALRHFPGYGYRRRLLLVHLRSAP